MKPTHHAFYTALLLALSASPSTQAHAANADDKRVEKCYGVAKAGKNDCASKDGKHACAAHARKDADPNEWIYVPEGLCDKLAGGVKESH